MRSEQSCRHQKWVSHDAIRLAFLQILVYERSRRIRAGAPVIDHRGPEFAALPAGHPAGLQAVFRASGPCDLSEFRFRRSEAALMFVVPGDRIIVLRPAISRWVEENRRKAGTPGGLRAATGAAVRLRSNSRRA
jgi:hypothetical protein